MRVVIYGKPGCVNCDKAKILCTTKGVDFDYKVVGSDVQTEQLEEMVGGPVRSVPQIFIMQGDGFAEYVGGFDQLREKL